MSNPTNLAEQFVSSLGAFTGVEPIRFRSGGGLHVEQGATNRIANPLLATGSTSWTSFSGGGARATDASVVHPETGETITTVWRNATFSNTNVGGVSSPVFNPAQGAVYTGSVVVVGTGTAIGKTIQARLIEWGGSTGTENNLGPGVVLTGQPQIIQVSRTIVRADRQGLDLTTVLTSGTSGDHVEMTAVQIELGAYRTSFCPWRDPVTGNPLPGYSWAGTAHASTSTRAASSAAISPAGILSPSSGALAFRITPTIETGVEEIWGECGVKGSGTDHVQWGRDSSKHPFVEWSANNASYQRLTGSETLNALTAYDLYLGHNATTISLAVDAGTLQTGTRDAVSGSWGAGNLTLEATAGGVVYNQFAAFNRTLSASEIKTLDRRNSWSRTMFGNPFAYFQLRPY